MLVSCPSCDSQYQIADDKVAGSLLRTRCKACGSQIVVDGTMSPASSDYDDDDDDVTRIMRPGDSARVSDRAAPPSGHRWTVQVNENDSRPMTANEIVQAFASGALGDGVSVWKNGMANWASISDVPELMSAIQESGRNPKTGSVKPPPPVRTGNTGQFPVAQSSKPPPPPARSKAPASASQKPTAEVNPADVLDPSASSSDFYSKLLSKVGASKPKTGTPSVPPVESHPILQPKRSQPPMRESAAPVAERNTQARPATAPSHAPSSGGASSIDHDAAPGDFYAKILAKVRPQKDQPAPSAAAPADARQTTDRRTLPPPSWGPGSQSEKPAAPQPPTRSASSAPAIATAPIRVVRAAPPPPSPTPSVPPPPAPFSGTTTADGLGDIEVHVDMSGGNFPEPPNVPAAANVNRDPFAAAAAVRPTPAPPTKRVEPSVPPPGIQLPPIKSTLIDARMPAIPGPGYSQAGPMPVPQSVPAPRPDSVAPGAQPGVEPGRAPQVSETREIKQPQPKRFAGMIIAVVVVGLLGVGGGVAATFYALKSSMKGTNAPVASTPVAVAAGTPAAAPPQASATPAPQVSAAASVAAAASAQSQAARSPSSDEHAPAAKGQRPASAAAHVAAVETPKAEKPDKTAAAVPAQTDSNIPAWLDTKSAGKKSDKAEVKLPPAPVEKPTKATAAAGSAPFAKETAQAMLGIAASQAPACKKPGGPTGTGKAIVTFDTDGSVVITNIVGEGFSGTPTGQCLAALFRRIRVPPFAGDRATATKVFTIPP